MNLIDQREGLVKDLAEISTKINTGIVTDADYAAVDAKTAQIAELDVKIASNNRLEKFLGQAEAPERDGDELAKSFGEAFVKSAGYDELLRGNYGSRTEVKAATDIHTFGEVESFAESARNLGLRQAPTQRTIFDWLKPETITEGAVKWVEETADEGQFEIVAEGALKPQLHFGYTPKSDTLHTAAGWFDTTTQMIRLAGQFAADINRRGLRRLILDQERLVLGATQATDGFNGILNYSGLGTVSGTEMFTTLYEAIEQAEDVGEFPVDGIVMNRKDWGKLVTSQNAEGNYYSGSPFGSEIAERVWNTPVIVSSRIAEGTALVGASQNAAVFTEPTVHIDVTNSDGDKFRRNIVTTRIEQDILSLLYRPAGMVKVTFTTGE